MKLKDLGSYLIVLGRTDRPDRYMREMKRLEWLFIGVRWVWVPVVFLMAWLHHPAQTPLMVAFGGALAFCNIIASLLNPRIKTPAVQRALGMSMLAVDTLLAWGVILVFVGDFYTAAYAGFIYVILEAAVRYGTIGSLAMSLVFVLGLYGAFLYREAAFGVRFSVSGYVFWTVLMAIVALPVGIIVNEGRRQRRQGEAYLRENTLLAERHRIARDLHDTVLKTLQGLSLEAHALGNRTDAAPVRETARYIEEVCARTGQEIREVIFDLRGESASAGIGSQIRKLLEDWGRAADIPGEFSLEGEEAIIPSESARQLRSVVAEALDNVQRHAAASHVHVCMTHSAGGLDLEISDDGRGIGRGIDELPAFVAEGKLGIAGMKERVELLGGRFSLDSGPGGTRISVHLPITESSNHGPDNSPDR
jgi:signal transduction histidine kinase